jgi:hypothetical protein
MKLVTALALLGAASLAACGGGKGEGLVKFRGSTPNTSKQMTQDLREVRSYCPGCLRPLEIGTERCPEKKTCGIPVSWKNSYACGPCQGSGVCQACRWMEQEDGKCFNCRGQGILIYQGKNRDCTSCKGKGACPLCAGSRKCDSCKGERTIPADEVKARVAKGRAAAAAEDEPASKPAEKKEEGK